MGGADVPSVLLISTNRETLPDPVFPLGLAYVAAALDEAGHEVRTLDLCFRSGEELDAVISSALSTGPSPDVVGLSLRNIDDGAQPENTSYIDLYEQVVGILRRQLPTVPLVVGGAGFTIMPGEFLARLDVDYGVVGEGERAMVELVDLLAAGPPGPSDTLPAGVVTAAEPHRSRPQRRDDWTTLRPARRHFSADDYYEKGGMLSLQTRRGCPFKCVYCSYPRIEGSRVRLRPLEDAVDEAERLVTDQGFEHLFIVDSVFNHPREYALKFCDELLRRRLEFRWTCYANVGCLDGELIERMQRAGCEGVELGTDGLVDEVLAALGKGFTYAEIAEASRLCRELGLRFCHFLFAGAPGETLDQAKLAVERLESLEADSSLIMAGIRVYPGTALARRAQTELGIEHCGLEPVFYVSPELADHLEAFMDQVIADHPKWIVPGYRRNISERIQRVLRRAGKRGVLWDFLSPR